MPPQFQVLATPAFEKEGRKLTRRNPDLVSALEKLVLILGDDPYNRGGQHNIKKLAGLKPGQGQWRIRFGDYRLRYDIFGQKIVLHSFRHRREAY